MIVDSSRLAVVDHLIRSSGHSAEEVQTIADDYTLGKDRRSWGFRQVEGYRRLLVLGTLGDDACEREARGDHVRSATIELCENVLAISRWAQRERDRRRVRGLPEAECRPRAPTFLMHDVGAIYHGDKSLQDVLADYTLGSHNGKPGTLRYQLICASRSDLLAEHIIVRYPELGLDTRIRCAAYDNLHGPSSHALDKLIEEEKP